MCSHIALSATAACTMISRLHPNVGGSPTHPAESSSLSCGPAVRFRLLPTPPHGDAVAFSYGTVAYTDTDSHHADKSPSWAHDETALPPVESKFISLHVKALVGDRQRCFAGSLNLDPRAIDINTENGLYIQSRELCAEMAAEFDRLMTADNAWRVGLDEKNRLYWESLEGRVTRQPARGFGQRIADFFFRLLPIESQL